MLDVIPGILKLRDHWRRRLRRMDLLAIAGRGPDWNVFGHRRAYAAGGRDAVEEVVKLLDGELAKQGLEIRDEPLPTHPDRDIAFIEATTDDLFTTIPYSPN